MKLKSFWYLVMVSSNPYRDSICRRPCLSRNFVKIYSKKPLLQDEDHSGYDPHLIPGFLYLISWMSPEQLPSEPELGSDGTRQVWRAPKMQFSVLLNSWDNFFITLPSTSSDTWVIDSSCILGRVVSSVWLFLG